MQEPQEALGHDKGKQFNSFSSSQNKKTEIANLMTTPIPTSPSDISSSCKDQVIITIVLCGKNFLKVTNLKPVWHVPFKFSEVNTKVTVKVVQLILTAVLRVLTLILLTEVFVSPEHFI